MRRRISIRGCVRPSVRPSVRPFPVIFKRVLGASFSSILRFIFVYLSRCVKVTFLFLLLISELFLDCIWLYTSFHCNRALFIISFLIPKKSSKLEISLPTFLTIFRASSPTYFSSSSSSGLWVLEPHPLLIDIFCKYFLWVFGLTYRLLAKTEYLTHSVIQFFKLLLWEIMKKFILWSLRVVF